MKERIGNLLKAINRGLYEKETETALSPLRHLDEEEDDGQKKNDCR